MEDALHAIRDCLRARKVWEAIIPASLHNKFFLLGLGDWLLWILRGKGAAEEAVRWTGKVLMLVIGNGGGGMLKIFKILARACSRGFASYWGAGRRKKTRYFTLVMLTAD